MTARACGSSSPAALSGPGETVHGYHLNPPTPFLVALGEPGLEHLLGPARDHVQKPGRTTAVAYGGQVDDDGDIAVAPPGVAPHVLIDPENLHTVEAIRVAGDGLLSPSQDCVVGGVPGVPPGRLPPGRPTCTPGQGPAAPTPPPSGSAGSWAQPRWRCPVSTPGGSGCRRSAARAPAAAWVSTPPVRGPGAGPLSHEPAPGRRRPCRTGPQTRPACGTPQWLSSRSGADPPR